jgi:ribosomal protein S19
LARSVWKGPFIDGYLLKKAEAAHTAGRNTVIKTWSRRSTILPQFVGLTFGVAAVRRLDVRRLQWAQISACSRNREHGGS